MKFTPTFRSLFRFYRAHGWIETCLVFAGVLLLYTAWTAAPVFVDPDAFYHAGVGELMAQTGQVIRDFPWLPFTTLEDAFVDHHLLYHGLLIPFVSLFGGITGLKVATAVLGAALVATFHWALRRMAIAWPLAWTLLLLSSTQFVFRIGLGKANSVSLILLLLGVVALQQRNLRLLAATSFLYVWAYGGFVILPLIALLYALVQSSFAIFERRWPNPTIWTPVVISWLGMGAGLIIHPSFPTHLQFYWEQLVQIGVINYGATIGVGGEWYPLAITDLFVEPLLVTTALFVAAIVTIYHWRKVTPLQLTAWIIWAIFALLTLKSQRYIEYAIPFAVLATAANLSPVLPQLVWPKKHQEFLPQVSRLLLIVVPAVLVLGWWLKGAQLNATLLQSGIPTTRYAKVSEWLQNYARPGEVIFHNDWDDFPMLFFRANHLRYIAGLDPTFFYRQDSERYAAWVSITLGEPQEHLFDTVTGTFNSQLVFVEHGNQAMWQLFATDPQFYEVYQDDEVTLFRANPVVE